MRKILLIFVCSLIGLSQMQAHSALGDPKPEKIEYLAKVSKSNDYYVEQVGLWEAALKENPKDAAGWFNYYLACRYANFTMSDGQPLYELDGIVERMGKAIPDAFEYHFAFAKQSPWTDEGKAHLFQAYELNPDDEGVISGMLTYYLVERDDEQVKFFLDRWYRLGVTSPGLAKWNYNALQSVEKNGILLSFGDNDSYYAWMLQEVKSVRKDIEVMSLPLFGLEDYKNKVLSEQGLPALERQLNDGPDFYKAVIDHFVKYSDRPIYLGLGVPKDLRAAYSDSLYLVGLAFKYYPEAFDNLSLLASNYETKFHTEYLNLNVDKDPAESVVNRMNLNYLPAFLSLYKHYLSEDNEVAANEVKALSLKIAERGGNLSQIEDWFATNTPRKLPTSLISVKDLDKALFIPGTGNMLLAAFDTEVTNEQYEAFLMDLLKNRNYDLLEKCKVNYVDWTALVPEEYKELGEERWYFNGHPDDPEVPVVNITHEAAKEYCKWITDVYNSSDYKKKKYAKVKFRLPTEAEWEYIAKGGFEDTPYPWGGNFYRNAKKCMLSNFGGTDISTLDCEDCYFKIKGSLADGALFVVNGDAYFPNNYGIYGMSGNVAEMVQEPNLAKGGSWSDDPIECQITSKKYYEGRRPDVGFRVVMEIIEQ